MMAIRRPVPMAIVVGLVCFVALVSVFFASLGRNPVAMLSSLVVFALGDTYSLSQTLAKTTPILLCALAVAVPGRLGLISVGAEGQLHAGAIGGTAMVLLAPDLPGILLIPLMLCGAAAGGGVNPKSHQGLMKPRYCTAMKPA